MGSGIARLVLAKQGLALVGAYGRRKERAGMDLGPAIELNRQVGIGLSTDLPAMLAQTRPHVAIQATCSRLTDAREEIVTLVRHGVHVISIAEEMAYPAVSAPVVAEEFHRLAIEHGVSILGTGINPGFVLDLLVIALTGVCSTIESITATRVNDLSPYGPSVLRTQGVGLTPEAFDQGLADGSVVGHFGFAQSIHMITTTLGWEIDDIQETRTPIISQVRRETPFVTIEPGQVAGCFHTAVAYRRRNPVITLIHPQQVRPHLEGGETGDMIEIVGIPHIRLSGSPEIPGGQGTIALAVNMIPRVLTASPGLHTMADLPVPAAILGDARKSLHRTAQEHRDA
jgi:4-hydroxy-tetrahydrodipicolinate reductase